MSARRRMKARYARIQRLSLTCAVTSSALQWRHSVQDFVWVVFPCPRVLLRIIYVCSRSAFFLSIQVYCILRAMTTGFWRQCLQYFSGNAYNILGAMSSVFCRQCLLYSPGYVYSIPSAMATVFCRRCQLLPFIHVCCVLQAMCSYRLLKSTIFCRQCLQYSASNAYSVLPAMPTIFYQQCLQ